MKYDEAKMINNGEAVLGVELGSTRIKTVLIGPDKRPLASGGFGWENIQVDGIWSFALEDAWSGITGAISELNSNIIDQYGVELTSLSAVGFSAMMHGYLAFDSHGKLLVPFRTWRNNITAEASKELTQLFQYPILQRWSVAHLHQAILNGENHVKDLAFITTLSGYVHWCLTGEKVIGIGDASGMFPIDISKGDYNQTMIDAYDSKIASNGYSWKLGDILPKIVPVGQEAGRLTEDGAKLLDPSGKLCREFRYVRPKATPVPGWWQPTVYVFEPEMFRQEHRCSPCW
ncbi:MAG: FGGY family carbohydrate kinase [Spirochaetaceae bacterium]|nr:FGGY family carbohydrate kinase [Spirochaetaceae bacterium]